MIKRFKIEDLIVQDSSGVVFRAMDTETGKTVAVRRFFPFGVDGGGLHAEEQTAYDIAIARLAGISHPALRSVVCGGCDPVDGMPFIATEWIEGHSLLPIVEQGPIPAESATELITNALEVCELLSQVLAEEAVWVETDVQTIVIGDENSGRRFTFWISPLKWLGSGDEPRGLKSIVNLTEEVMGWKGQAVNDEAGRGLGGWLNWLRHAASTTNLHEAREALAASIGAEPPASAKKLVTRAVVPTKPLRPVKPIRKSQPKTLLIVNIVLVLILAGLGCWMWMRMNPDSRLARLVSPKQNVPQEAVLEPETAPPADTSKAEPAALPAAPESLVSDEEKTRSANRRLAELSLKSEPKPATKPSPEPPAVADSAAVIQWDNHDLLLRSDKKHVVVEGTPVDVVTSQSGITAYLLFAPKSERDAARAGIKVGVSEGNEMMEKLKLFIGKKIRVSGMVNLQKIAGLQRPDIMMDDLSAVQPPP